MAYNVHAHRQADQAHFSKKWSKKRIVRNEYDLYEDAGLDCSNDPGLTDQSQAKETDINVIIKRAEATGFLPVSQDIGQYGDFSNLPDFAGSLSIVNRARDSFNALPAMVRAKFENDPAKVIAFLSDEANRDEAIYLGLLPKSAAKIPSPADPVPAAAAPASAPASAPVK